MEQQDLETRMKKDSLKGTMRPLVKTSGNRAARGGVKSKHRSRLSCNNNHLLRHNLSEMYTPLSTCSESNLSEINSSSKLIPSAYSSYHDSSAFSDYEDYEDDIEDEINPGNVVCRIEIEEDDNIHSSKEDVAYQLQRSTSFTEDR